MTETDAAVWAERVPEGFGGWLIVPIIGLVVTPLRAVFHLADYGELFASTERLPAGLSAFLMLEFVGNIVFLLVLPIILLFGDILAATGQTPLDAEGIQELIRSIILVVVWIPYMRASRRVANTFIN
jgi:hypothetical protein